MSSVVTVSVVGNFGGRDQMFYELKKSKLKKLAFTSNSQQQIACVVSWQGGPNKLLSDKKTEPKIQLE